jgi:hypothetical protein
MDVLWSCPHQQAVGIERSRHGGRRAYQQTFPDDEILQMATSRTLSSSPSPTKNLSGMTDTRAKPGADPQ